jgi:hypothetical protein
MQSLEKSDKEEEVVVTQVEVSSLQARGKNDCS